MPQHIIDAAALVGQLRGKFGDKRQKGRSRCTNKWVYCFPVYLRTYLVSYSSTTYTSHITDLDGEVARKYLMGCVAEGEANLRAAIV